MGTKIGRRSEEREVSVRFLVNDGGPVAQLFHPCRMGRGDISRMADILLRVDALLDSDAPQVSVVITGGGLLEVPLDEGHPPRFWRSEAGLDRLLSRAHKDADILRAKMRSSVREYVVGLDYVSEQEGLGQFALVLGRGETVRIVWKSSPIGREDSTLAGFGTSKGRESPRIVQTALGQTLVLVCHDAQAFNHRNIKSVKKGTPRARAMEEMHDQVAEQKPAWALNLVHWIADAKNTRTFRNSYKQMHLDHAWHPKVVAAFGYERRVRRDLASLSRNFQFPAETTCCALAIEVR